MNMAFANDNAAPSATFEDREFDALLARFELAMNRVGDVAAAPIHFYEWSAER